MQSTSQIASSCESASPRHFLGDLVNGLQDQREPTQDRHVCVHVESHACETGASGTEDCGQALESFIAHGCPDLGRRPRQTAAPGRAALPPAGQHSRERARQQQAEQRLRSQQKARVSALQADVDEAAQRLHEGRARQLQLEAQLGAASTMCLHLVDAHQSISLTILSNEQVRTTVQYLSSMPFDRFSTLYSAYVRKIGECLSDKAEPSSSSSSSSQAAPSYGLQKWTGALNRLRIFLAVGNAKAFVSYVGSRLDGSSGPDASKLPDTWYHSIIDTLQLTVSQKIGMMHIRRLFYAKLGAVRRQRQKLLQQVPLSLIEAEFEASSNPSSRLSSISCSAQQLQENSDVELRAYLHVSAFLRLSTEGRGILTSRQQAQCVVTAFPYSPDKLRLLELLATVQQEPPVSVLVQQGGVDDFEHYANWHQIVHLLQTVTQQNLHLDVPVANL